MREIGKGPTGGSSVKRERLSWVGAGRDRQAEVSLRRIGPCLLDADARQVPALARGIKPDPRVRNKITEVDSKKINQIKIGHRRWEDVHVPHANIDVDNL